MVSRVYNRVPRHSPLHTSTWDTTMIHSSLTHSKHQQSGCLVFTMGMFVLIISKRGIAVGYEVNSAEEAAILHIVLYVTKLLYVLMPGPI